MPSKPEPTMTDVLNRAEADHNADIMANAIETLDTEAAAVEQAPPPAPTPAPYHYNTETTEVARTFVNQIDRLSRLIHEDDTEIEFNEKERDRLIHELQVRFEEEQEAVLSNCRQANSIAMARRADRVNARGAIQRTVDALQEK